MKILFVSPLSLRFGGGGTSWLIEIAKHLKNLSNAIKVVALDYDTGTKRITQEDIQNVYLRGIPYQEIPLRKTFLDRIGLLMPSSNGFKRLISYLEESDVVYFMNAHGLDLIFSIIKKIKKKHFISGIHAPLHYGSKIRDIYNSTLAKIIFKAFDSHHVLNDFYYDLLKRWRLKNIFKIPPGVDIEKFSPPEDLSFLKCPSFKVMFVGRLAKQKGIDILCRTIKKLATFKDIEFYIYGSGKHEFFIKELKSNFNNVNWYGYLPFEKIPEAYKKMHLIFMPSRQENFSATILEALSTGLVGVVSDISGLREVIDESNGRIVSLDKEEGFSEAIVDLYNIWKRDFEKYLKMREFSRKVCVDNYSWQKISLDMENMFKKCS